MLPLRVISEILGNGMNIGKLLVRQIYAEEAASACGEMEVKMFLI